MWDFDGCVSISLSISSCIFTVAYIYDQIALNNDSKVLAASEKRQMLLTLWRNIRSCTAPACCVVSKGKILYANITSSFHHNHKPGYIVLTVHTCLILEALGQIQSSNYIFLPKLEAVLCSGWDIKQVTVSALESYTVFESSGA